MNSMCYGFSGRSICRGNGYKPPNSHQWGPGVRDVYALHYIASGKGYLETGQATFPLKTGDSFMIFPHKEVYYYPDPQDPWEYFWIEFSGAEASRLLSMIHIAPDHPTLGASPQDFKPLFHMVKTAGITPFEQERSDAGLHLLLSYYMEYYPSERAFLTKDYALSAREYIENNFWRPSLSVLDVVVVQGKERHLHLRLYHRLQNSPCL